MPRINMISFVFQSQIVLWNVDRSKIDPKKPHNTLECTVRPFSLHSFSAAEFHFQRLSINRKLAGNIKSFTRPKWQVIDMVQNVEN